MYFHLGLELQISRLNAPAPVAFVPYSVVLFRYLKMQGERELKEED